MNIFGFDLSQAEPALFMAFAYGVWFGLTLGLFRYLIFRVVESKTP